MPILVSSSADLHQITLEGVLDIGAAAELKTILLDALRSGQHFCVSVGAVTDLDVTAFQLLWAARREAERSAASFTVTGPLQESVRLTLTGLGLDELLAAESSGTEA